MRSSRDKHYGGVFMEATPKISPRLRKPSEYAFFARSGHPQVTRHTPRPWPCLGIPQWSRPSTYANIWACKSTCGLTSLRTAMPKRPCYHEPYAIGFERGCGTPCGQWRSLRPTRTRRKCGAARVPQTRGGRLAPDDTRSREGHPQSMYVTAALVRGPPI